MDHPPPRSQPPEEYLSEHTVHDLCAPLAIIKGQAQLLQRWVQKGSASDHDVALARLELIDTMVTRLADRIHTIRCVPGDDPSDDASRDR